MFYLRSLALPLFALTVVLGGCAASSEETTADESAVSSESAITIGNYMSHPKIVAIRTKVAEVDFGTVQVHATENPGCDGTNTKYEDARGQIRKFYSIGGEGGFEGTNTAYYDEAGKLLFVFTTQRWLEEQNGAFWKGTDQRIYYGDDGKILFQVIREGQAPEPDQIQMGADRLPLGDEVWRDEIGGAWLADPATAFSARGCGEEIVACTTEARECPDGSFVGRSGPNCEFAACAK